MRVRVMVFKATFNNICVISGAGSLIGGVYWRTRGKPQPSASH